MPVGAQGDALDDRVSRGLEALEKAMGKSGMVSYDGSADAPL
jgi:hypothetical protein